jgi:hypothetical protein
MAGRLYPLPPGEGRKFRVETKKDISYYTSRQLCGVKCIAVFVNNAG